MPSQPNYIQDLNRYKLAGPPAWWCKKLWEFDPSLVVVPSRQSFVYRLAQRRKISLTDKICQDSLFNESDTKMLTSYGLIPVTSILSTANWSNPYLFEELRRRAPWRLGGAEAVTKRLDEEDAKAELDKRAATDAHLSHLSKDAWKYYKTKVGLRGSIDLGAK